LGSWPKYPDPSMARWRIESNVGEVEIQSNKDSIFFQANIEDC
jgi:hypothetical protein